MNFIFNLNIIICLTFEISHSYSLNNIMLVRRIFKYVGNVSLKKMLIMLDYFSHIHVLYNIFIFHLQL